MIDCLVARAATKAMSLATLTVEMKLEGGPIHRLSIQPALPSVDRKFLLKLLQLEIAAHPPQAAVQSMTMTAEAGQSSKVQLGLFAPQTPEPSRLDVTIARLKALAGEDRVGSPLLEDSHRTGSFRMESFVAEDHSVATKVQRPHMALRRMRPPLAVRMVMRADRPAIFHDGQRSYRVEAAFGPWRSQGSWWAADEWDTDEWDVLAQAQDSSPVACLLVLDRTRDRWCLEAFYD
jgi:protein ImuB